MREKTNLCLGHERENTPERQRQIGENIDNLYNVGNTSCSLRRSPYITKRNRHNLKSMEPCPVFCHSGFKLVRCAWLLVLMTAGAVIAQDKPAEVWSLSKEARAMTSPLGHAFTRMQLTSQTGMATMGSPRIMLEKDKQSRLFMRYRTSAKSSGRDLGACQPGATGYCSGRAGHTPCPYAQPHESRVRSDLRGTIGDYGSAAP